MRRGLAWLGFLALLGSACGEEDATKIVVAVWSDLAVPNELDGVRIDVNGPSGGSSDSFALTTGAERDKTRLPVLLDLVPLAAKDATFTVRAAGLLGLTELVSQTARVSFVPGQARLLKLFLARACAGAVCPAELTCSGGACTQPVAVTDLPPYRPGAPLLSPDAGSAIDASWPRPNADAPTGADAVLGTDGGGIPDVGSSADTHRPDLRLPDTFDAPLVPTDAAVDVGSAGGWGGRDAPGTGGGSSGTGGAGGATSRRDAGDAGNGDGLGGSPGTGGVSGLGGTATGGSPSVAWVELKLGLASTSTLGKVAVGAGRGDDVVRVYAGEDSAPSDKLYEWSYATSNWALPVAIHDTDLMTIAGLVIGDVRNNGALGIYASGYGFAEFRHETAGWTRTAPNLDVSNGIQWNNGLSLGAGRNDGYQRVYVADWDRIVEISYDFGDWAAFEIDTGNQWASATVVAKGRNDGKNYLYAALGTMGGPIWELAWSASSNKYEIVQNISQPTSGGYRILCTGAGRNDDVQRIYGWGDAGLHEWSHAQGVWTKTVVSGTAFSPASTSGTTVIGGLLLADGRNDGFIRLYAADAKGVGEYTYDGAWRKTGLVTSNPARGMDVGRGRNDSKNRIYVSEDYNLFEYTAEQNPSPDAGAGGG